MKILTSAGQKLCGLSLKKYRVVTTTQEESHKWKLLLEEEQQHHRTIQRKTQSLTFHQDISAASEIHRPLMEGTWNREEPFPKGKTKMSPRGRRGLILNIMRRNQGSGSAGERPSKPKTVGTHLQTRVQLGLGQRKFHYVPVKTQT